MHLWQQAQKQATVDSPHTPLKQSRISTTQTNSSIWKTASAALPTGRTLRLDLAFLGYSFPFPQLKRISAWGRHGLPAGPKAHLCNTSEDSSSPPNCQQYVPTQSDEVNIKYRQAWWITCRLKGPWSPLASFWVCYKNSFGYKCLHSTDFISKPASVLSHPNESGNAHAQTASPFTSVNSKRPRIVLKIFLIGNDSAMIQTTNYNALKIPTPVGLDERLLLHATVIKD